MIIVGSGGFAKEILDVFEVCKQEQELVFFNNIDPTANLFLNRFPIIHTDNEVVDYFQCRDRRFLLGIGGPQNREKLFKHFCALGGTPYSVIGCNAVVSSIDTSLGEGLCLLNGCVVSAGSSIGNGCLVYYSANVTHDCVIGNFCEISPGACVLGGAIIGNRTHIGANATILPKIRIGCDVRIGAGAVVTQDIPDNTTAVGVPAVIIKHHHSN
jgi:sugar O-acyltransferase (sialic acid O-acetyltransferase NeuD family)